MKDNSKLLSNIIVTVSGKMSVMLIQFTATLILSRMLSPQDFGIIAMCTIFLNISEVLVDSGMAGSIIFHKDIKEIELHTLFWTNFSISLSLYLIIYISSEMVAKFYQIDILSLILKVISISIILHSLCIIQSTLLSKNLQFQVQSKILFFSAVLSTILVLGLAYYLKSGIWALVAQPILLKLIQTALFFVYGSRYRPKLQFSSSALKRHWSFGSKLLGTSLLKLLYENIYVQVIGMTINIKDAGFYSQAKRLNDIPTNIIAYPLERVIFPSLVNSNNVEAKMDKMTSLFSTVIIPTMFCGSLVSKSLVLFLFGSRWVDSGWMLSFLFLGTIGASLEGLNRSFIKVSGKTNILLKFDFLKRVVNMSILVCSMYWGLVGILIAYIINGVIGWIFNCYALKVAINYDIKKQISQVLTIFLISLIPYLFVSTQTFIQTNHVFLNIIAQSILYTLAFIGLLLIFQKEKVYALCQTISNVRR